MRFVRILGMLGGLDAGWAEAVRLAEGGWCGWGQVERCWW